MNTSNMFFLLLIGGMFAVVGVFIVANALATDHQQADQSPWTSVAFGGVFASVGIVMVLIGVRERLSETQQEDVQRQFPDQPWQWDDDWRSGRIEHNAKWQAIALWAFSILWNSIVFAGAVIGGEDLLSQASEEPMTYLILLFPVVGLVVLSIAVRSTLQWRRYGTSTLVLRSVPVRMGGQMEATIQLPSDVRSAAELQVRVACTRTTRRGKNTTTTVLWSDERTYPGMALGVGPKGPTLSIKQEMPNGYEQSSVGSVNPSVDWKVEVSADVEGVDFQAEYNIPVFPG